MLRIGVLGSGAWAEHAHLPGFKRDDRCALVAIADPDVAKARSVAAMFGIPSVYASHAELLARPDIDVVDVCTPSLTHFPLAWAALEAGKHVLCEKPVAEDYRDMRRATGTMMLMNIDDGDIFIGEFASGALGSIQTSFVTVGNDPGLEARVYGSTGALICRLVEEDGICESLKAATADQVEFRELTVPASFYPPGGSNRESWRSLFYANLIRSFVSEILSDGPENEGDFDDGAHVQELINAVTLSFRERRWVPIPLSGGGT